MGSSLIVTRAVSRADAYLFHFCYFEVEATSEKDLIRNDDRLDFYSNWSVLRFWDSFAGRFYGDILSDTKQRSGL